MTKQQQETENTQRYAVEFGPWFRVDVTAASPREAALDVLELGSANQPVYDNTPGSPSIEDYLAEHCPENIVQVVDGEGQIKLVADAADLSGELSTATAPIAASSVQHNQLDTQPNQLLPLQREGNSVVRWQDEVSVDTNHVYDILQRFPDWEEMDVEGGMRLLSAIEEAQSLEEGRECCKIELDRFVPVEGKYDRARNTITLKSELLDLADYQPALRSLFQQERACSQSLAAERQAGKQASSTLLRKDQLVFAAKRIRALAKLQVARAKAEDQRRDKCRGGQPPPLVRKRIHQLQKQQEIE